MNRRSFFNRLSAAVAGCYLAAHVKLADIAVAPETVSAKVVAINPEWVNAPYELSFLVAQDNDHGQAMAPVVHKRGEPPTGVSYREAFPIRFTSDGRTVIPPMVEM